MEQIRLQKFLAEAGIASRRNCEELIINGKIKVNGKIATLGEKVNPMNDKIEYNGNIIKAHNNEYTYILLNKPIDYVTTAKDQFGRKTVLDLVNIKNKRLLPVRKIRYVYIWCFNTYR